MKTGKSFGLALILWLFGGMIGLHRIYIQEKVSVIIWYWFVAFITFGLFPIIDLFRLKSLIEMANLKAKVREL